MCPTIFSLFFPPCTFDFAISTFLFFALGFVFAGAGRRRNFGDEYVVFEGPVSGSEPGDPSAPAVKEKKSRALNSTCIRSRRGTYITKKCFLYYYLMAVSFPHSKGKNSKKKYVSALF